MKICFPIVNDEGMESRIYGHFGSAPRFLAIDMETDEVMSFDNIDRMAPEAGCNPFKALVGRQFDGIVVAGIGDSFLEMLHMLGIKVYQAESEHVAENLELFKQNALSQVEMQNSAEAGRCAGVAEDGHCGHHH